MDRGCRKLYYVSSPAVLINMLVPRSVVTESVNGHKVDLKNLHPSLITVFLCGLLNKLCTFLFLIFIIHGIIISLKKGSCQSGNAVYCVEI